MMLTFLDKKVKHNFSKASGHYEEFSSLHRHIGLRLLDQIEQAADHAWVLDIGMGTGWLTRRITERCLESNVVGLDYAEGMVRAARMACRKTPFFVLQADARALPFRRGSFDIIVSNCVYQWIDNLPRALSACADILKDRGVFYFSCFGEKTLSELFVSLRQTSKGNRIFPARDFVSREYLCDAFSRSGFKNVIVDREIKKIPFGDIVGLVRWLKNIGANNPREDIFVGRQWFDRANEFYRKNFREGPDVTATFEILWGAARK